MSEIKHEGTPRHSGRYPWGSGKDPQRNRSFFDRVKELEDKGLSEVEVANALNLNTRQLRQRASIEKAAKRASDSAMALRLKNKGYSNVAIGKRMGINESSVRALLNPGLQQRSSETAEIANVLKDRVKEIKYLDIGAGTENHLAVSKTKLNTAVAMLEQEGYTVHYIKTKQQGTGKYTWLKILAPPGVETSEVSANRNQIDLITSHKPVEGTTNVLGLLPINNISSNRVHIRYAEDKGDLKDGVIELRKGVEDLSLGPKKYAQVRIGVDGTHYLKGMALYSDNMPDGADIVFNTNKSKVLSKKEVLKKNEDDPDNPFGSVVSQKEYIDRNGNKKVSALNIVNEEGNWEEWSKTLSSQFLSKQLPSLAKKQLGLALDAKQKEYDEILSLTNPTIKKRFLDSFAGDADAAAVHLKAAALPREGTHVILPFTSIKENEVYAPNFNDGESVVLIRHPHGGIFEIPELVVNNKNREATSSIGRARDAVGIHPKVAQKLSGADFDGDTVLVIPNTHGEVKTAPSLRALKNFNPREEYKAYPGMKIMDGPTKQREMGLISNLITDMTIKAANEDEIARAVKHSMVVIDAEKHKLNYTLSFNDNNIAALKKKYQGGERAGASTLISKSSSDKRVDYRKDRGIVTTSRNTDPLTGKKIYDYTSETYIQRKQAVDPITGKKLKDPLTGKKIYVPGSERVVPRKTKTTKMAEAEDAFELSSGTRMEAVYATYANNLKRLADEARKASLNTPNLIYSPSAKETYKREVDALNAKLNIAYRNKPHERQAVLLSNQIVRAKLQANPNLEPGDIKKLKGQAIVEARLRTGAKKEKIEITDREWEAIQAGAISHNKLSQILLNSDMDKLKARALPKSTPILSAGKEAKARTMLDAGKTRAEVANSLGISVTTLNRVLG